MRRETSNTASINIRKYQSAAFVSAFLLFLIQPVMAKAMLPTFGGSYLVWGTCMVFFQGLLLAGYAYAHFVQRVLGVLRYSRWHWLVLFSPLLFFPFHFSRFHTENYNYPAFLQIMGLLGWSVGVPFFSLSTASLVLQRWLAHSNLPESGNPYILYSPSNLGSLLGLLSYPILIEPGLNLSQQGILWWVGYILLLFFFLSCLPEKSNEKESVPGMTGTGAVSKLSMVTWFILSASGTIALLAITNTITFDVAPVPFLWVLPLGTYLLSFVLLFKQRPWFPDWIRGGLGWFVIVGMLLYVMNVMRLRVPMLVSLVLNLMIIFVICMNCHGYLVRTKSGDVRCLTLFYLIISFGGFCGSLTVSWLIPLVSSGFVEYPMALIMALIGVGLVEKASFGRNYVALAISTIVTVLCLTLIPTVLSHNCHLESRFIFVFIAVPLILSVRYLHKNHYQQALLLLVAALTLGWTEELMAGALNSRRFRNFYGVYKIYDQNGIRFLQHGTTQHGRQYIDPERASIPLSYYHRTAPAGELLSSSLLVQKSIGMIGLGTGALAMYVGKGQTLIIYELDSDGVRVAEEDFSYLKIARQRGVDLRLVVGDGRISLRREPDAKFDILIIDAFSSGSIPTHLLTIEAITEYLRVLKPRGILLAHISNKVLNLKPLIFSVGHQLGLHTLVKSNEDGVHPDSDYSVWAVLCRDKVVADELRDQMSWRVSTLEADKLSAIWTDQHSNLLRLLF